MFSRDVLEIDTRQAVAADRGRRSAARSSATCAAAGVVVASPAGSTAPSWPRCAPARSGPSGSSGCSCPSGTPRATRCASAGMLAEQPRDPARRRGHRRRSLAALGCYERQAEAIRMVFPEYGDGLALQARPALRCSRATGSTSRSSPSPTRTGDERRSRMPPAAYLQLVAATNFKQRTRMMMEYYHADRLNYAVAGTPNLARVRPGLLREAGRRGGGLQADRPPLQDPGLRARRVPRGAGGDPARAADDRHVLARPDAGGVLLRAAVPARWTSACGPSTTGCRPSEAAPVIGLTAEQVERVYRDIEAKRRASRYLHHVPRRSLRPGLSRVRHRRVRRAARRDAAARRSRTSTAHGRRRCATAGPTSSALYRDERAGLGHARLSIIDLATGQQPLSNEDGDALDRLQRRDLQLRRAARRAAGAAATGSGRRATPR